MTDTATLEPEVLPAATDVSALADASANKPALWESERQRVEKFAASVTTILAPSDNPELQAKLARTTRLEIRPVRIAVEKMRKEFNEESQQKIKACNALAATITKACEDMEGRLLEVEQFAERAEAARILKLTEDRTAQLAAVGAMAPANVGSLTEDVFAAALEDATELQKLKVERERKAEEARQAQIEAARQEHLRVEAENARLKAEAAEAARLAKIETDRVAAERAEEQRKAKEEADAREEAFKKERAAAAQAAAEERAKIETAAREERDRLELARREAEAEAAKARKQAEAAAAKAKAEADAIAAERAKADAAEDAQRKAERAAAAKSAKAPDKGKLVSWLETFRALTLPEMKTDDGKQALVSVRTSMNRAYAEIKTAIESL